MNGRDFLAWERAIGIEPGPESARILQVTSVATLYWRTGQRQPGQGFRLLLPAMLWLRSERLVPGDSRRRPMQPTAQEIGDGLQELADDWWGEKEP